MPFFHQSVCISPQQSFPVADISSIRGSKNNFLNVIEPDYPEIHAGAKRRMGKSVRMAVGAALPLLQKYPQPDGILIATANGGMEDCIKFLNQILEYKEGLLTPANFVQSTSNAAAAQIALVTRNRQYNITHVNRGTAFENALVDVIMSLNENPRAEYLLGCTDEISAYNYNIDRVAGWFRDQPVLNTDLFMKPAKGTIPGEGSFMVIMNNNKQDAQASLDAVKTIHSSIPDEITNTLDIFLKKNFREGEFPDLLLTGENGDERLLSYYEVIESRFPETVQVARFKHLCGEYCTASSFACWLSVQILLTGIVPKILQKKNGNNNVVKRILIYNNYRGAQHGFILMSVVS